VPVSQFNEVNGKTPIAFSYESTSKFSNKAKQKLRKKNN